MVHGASVQIRPRHLAYFSSAHTTNDLIFSIARRFELLLQPSSTTTTIAMSHRKFEGTLDISSWGIGEHLRPFHTCWRVALAPIAASDPASPKTSRGPD